MPSSSSRHSLNKVSLSFFLYTLYLFSFLLFFLTFFFLVSCFEMVVEEPLRGTFQVSIFVDLITSRLKHVSISLLQFTALISVNSLLFYCLVRVSVGRQGYGLSGTSNVFISRFNGLFATVAVEITLNFFLTCISKSLTHIMDFVLLRFRIFYTQCLPMEI